MKNTIKDIVAGENIEQVLNDIMDRLFAYGPTDPVDLELLTYIKIYHPALFSRHEKSILMTMGLFFKDTGIQSFRDVVFDIYVNADGTYIRWS